MCLFRKHQTACRQGNPIRNPNHGAGNASKQAALVQYPDKKKKTKDKNNKIQNLEMDILEVLREKQSTAGDNELNSNLLRLVNLLENKNTRK